jgi:large repetitive protein
VPAAAITGPVFVTNAGGTTASDTSFTVLPKTLSITPTSGPVGTPVTIGGTGFDGSTVVNVNTTALTITSHTATQIKGTITAGSTTGNVTASGNTGGVGPLFKVTPKLNLPASPVQAGDTVTLTGSNLDDPPLPPALTPTLKLGTTVLSYTPVDSTHLRFTVPDTAVSAKLSFTNKWGTFTTASNLLVKPKILSFSPGDATAGTLVTITGKTFTGITAVKFNGVGAAFTLSAGAIKATVPTAATSGPITVTNAGGTETSADDFLVDPKITSITPTAGPVGAILSISGSGFGGADRVAVNGRFGTIQPGGTANLVKIQVLGGSTTGPVTVSTTTGAVQATGPSFRVLPSVSVGGFSPNPAHAGDVVQVTGWNLNDVASNGAKLGAVVLTDFHVDSNTAAHFTVPANATSAKLTLTSVAPAATTTSIDRLTIQPTVTGGLPAPAAAGQTMTFSGTFFGVNSVKFSGPGGGAPSVTALFTLLSPTSLRATVPTGAVDGLVRIATATSFVDSGPVVVLPKVASFSGTSGVAGPKGPLVTVNGSGFRPGAKVAFGTTAPADAAFVSSTKLTLRPPLGALSGKLTVTNPSDPAGPASASSFTVTLSVTGFSPPNPAPQTQVTVTGLGFNSSTRVYLGGSSTTPGSVMVVPNQPTTATQLTFKLPDAAPSGTVAVRNGTGLYTWSVATITPSFADLLTTEGPTGSTVALDGAGFEDGATVTFAGVSDIPAVVSAGGTHLTFTVPDGAVPASAAERHVEIHNPGGSVITSSGEFTVTLAITGVNPTSAAAGDQVVINGVGFAAGATVSFGGVEATAVTLDSATQITATVPDGAASGTVTVTTAVGTVSSADSFAITGGGASAATDSPQFAAATGI